MLPVCRIHYDEFDKLWRSIWLVRLVVVYGDDDIVKIKNTRGMCEQCFSSARFISMDCNLVAMLFSWPIQINRSIDIQTKSKTVDGKRTNPGTISYIVCVHSARLV